MNLSNKKILVTGGSTGIGKALIEELIQEGTTDFAVMGRTPGKLDELEEAFPSARFLKMQGDVSRLKDVKATIETVKEKWGSLDILINNAGVVSAGLLDEVDDEDIMNQVNINLTGVLLMTKYCLPMLKESQGGAIINISSGLGYIAMPFYSVYAATKAAVRHFSEAMRRELADYPIHVMTVYPTSTDTDMMKTANVDEMDSPQKVARATMEGLLHKKIEVILGGPKRKQLIRENFEAPFEVDKKIAGQFESLKERARQHRSM